MARKPTGKPTGRPEKPIDWNMFEQLCALQCTQDEMGGFLHVGGDTLSKRVQANYGEDYSTIYKRFSESGKCSLRRNQFVLSKKNASMAIWLGKQWLGQKDMSREEVKDIIEDLKHAIRESEERPRPAETSRPSLENKQPILYQGFTGEESQVSDELGAGRPLC